MDDIPPRVGIVFMICITIISVTIVVCECVKQKYAAPDNVVTSTETANAPTDEPTLTEEQARRAGAALMMRAATHAATGF